MFEAQTAEPFTDDLIGYEEPRRPLSGQPASEAAVEAAYTPSHYAAKGNRSLLWLVIAGHVLAFWAIVQFDVVGHHRPRQRLEVQLVPLDVVPPPKIAPPPEAADVKVQTPIVAPPPIVQQPVAIQQPVISAPIPVTSAPPPVTAAPAAPIVAEAAPIIPPDGMAATLGNPAPRYPMESRRNHEEGTVRLRVLISSQGTVEDIKVAKSSGFDRLDDAALSAVRKWRFRPGTQAGVPVEAVGFLSIPFKLTRS
ncbi:protein TonB [Sphingomonas vulcanisoli]|uniref:Protein TonB n=1 Tax=Sphingomonas vulcanisoli TaxID=1658060 RepID=A0ABX0TTJ7_9SPHN|nr:energy transducer TonB [Sphingomonas vulcanisoli]NIJ08781.1 protein TonB [Sphingomonas vulcanisoli]